MDWHDVQCTNARSTVKGEQAGWMIEACCNFGSVGSSSSSETRKSHRVRSFFQVSLSEWGGPTQRPSERERTDRPTVERPQYCYLREAISAGSEIDSKGGRRGQRDGRREPSGKERTNGSANIQGTSKECFPGCVWMGEKIAFSCLQ